MSSQGQLIVCRRCNETIPQEEGNCPHCGTSIRGDLPYLGVIVFGALLIGVTLLNPSDLLIFGILGVVAAGTAGYLFYNKRQRIQKANEQPNSVP